ncbi:accessory gland protein Acp29AB-like [Drosophila teissieri]|uniref:accessory gland protein Acp29AB-like n=1 Tax=Drosophila teissieri TaxID=7243 RepID=UPI001CBA49A2|nr:accessory gland protein Acp29AB-like [Drosophila teissieri]
MALHRSNCSEAVHVNETLEKLSGIEAKQKEMQQSLASLLDGQLELRTLNERVAELVFQVKEFKDTTDTLKHLLHSYINEIRDSLNATKVPPPLAGIKQPKFEEIGSHLFYIENNMRVTWDGAKDMCRAMGGQLASSESVVEFGAFQMNLHGNYCYWIRINDTEKKAGCSASARLGNSR